MALEKLSHLKEDERKKRIAKLAADPATRSRIPLRFLPEQYKAQRVARLRQNPGARIKLDDKYLTPAQQKQRLTAQRRAAPIMPGSQTTMGSVEDLARADITSEYAEPEQELRGAVGQSQRMSRAIPGWYDEYRKQVEASAQQQAAANAQITAALTNAAAQTQQNSTQSANENVAKLQADAASRGATVSPDVVNRALAAARSGAETQQLIAGGDAQAQNARVQSMFQQTGNINMAKGEALGRENRYLTDLLGEERALAKKKGAAYTSRVGEILNRERTSELEQKAFGLSEQKAAADVALERLKAKQAAADAAFDRKVKARELALRKQGLDADAAHDRAMEETAAERNRIAQQNANTAATKATTKTTKPAKESADNRKYRANITGNLADRIGTDAKKRGLNLKNAGERRKYVSLLKKTRGDWFTTPYGDALVSAALDYAALGRIHPVQVRKLRNMGLIITTKGAYGGPGAKG